MQKPFVKDDILNQEEGGKIDFKESYGFMLPKHEDISTKDWSKYIEGQWCELCKDVISLSNGSLSSEVSSAFIILGVREEGKLKQEANIELKIDKETMLKKINSFCSPPLNDIIIHDVINSSIKIIEIPYMTDVLETTKTLTMYSIVIENSKKTIKEKSKFSQYCVFFRSGDNNAIASLKEKNSLEYIKSQTGQFLVKEILKEARKNLSILIHVDNFQEISDPITDYKYASEYLKRNKTRILKTNSKIFNILSYYSLMMEIHKRIHDHRLIKSSHTNYDFRMYIQRMYEYSDEFFDLLQELEEIDGYVRNNKNKMGSLAAFIDKHESIPINQNDLNSGLTYLSYAAQLCQIYSSIISYFDKDYRLLLNSKSSLNKLMRDSNIYRRQITDKHIDSFITYQLSSLNDVEK